MSLVDVWSLGSCTDALMMGLIRALFFHTASFDIHLRLSYVPGAENIDADLLSRLQVREFRDRNPTAEAEPVDVPEEVWYIPGRR